MMLGYNKVNAILRGFWLMRKDYIKDQWCVEHVSTTIPKGDEIHKASYSSFLFLTKIRRTVNFIVRNVFTEIGEYEKEVECIYIYIYI
jgi:hypothetical protein